MSFVMVPVPEEHVFDVMRHIVRLHARSTQPTPWDRASLEHFLSQSANEQERSLLAAIAKEARAGRGLGTDAAAEGLGVDQDQLVLIGYRIRWLERHQEVSRPHLYELRQTDAPEGTGELVMDADVAELVGEVQGETSQGDETESALSS